MSHLYNLVNCDPCLWIHVTHGGQNTLQITTDRRGLEHKKFMYIDTYYKKIMSIKIHTTKIDVYQDTYNKNSCLSRYILQKFMFIKIHTTKIHVYQDTYYKNSCLSRYIPGTTNIFLFVENQSYNSI